MLSRSVNIPKDIGNAIITPASSITPPTIFPRVIETIARTNAASNNGSVARKKRTGLTTGANIAIKAHNAPAPAGERSCFAANLSVCGAGGGISLTRLSYNAFDSLNRKLSAGKVACS